MTMVQLCAKVQDAGVLASCAEVLSCIAMDPDGRERMVHEEGIPVVVNLVSMSADLEACDQQRAVRRLRSHQSRDLTTRRREEYERYPL